VRVIVDGAWEELRAVRADEVMKILQATDSFNISREEVVIPLQTEQGGGLTLQSDGRLRIVCPDAGISEEWLSELRTQLSKSRL
jgi:hypothetical protein